MNNFEHAVFLIHLPTQTQLKRTTFKKTNFSLCHEKKGRLDKRRKRIKEWTLRLEKKLHL